VELFDKLDHGPHSLESGDCPAVEPVLWGRADWDDAYPFGVDRCKISFGPWAVDVITSTMSSGRAECTCNHCVRCLYDSQWPLGAPHQRFDLDIVSVKLELCADGVLRTQRCTAAPMPMEIELRPRAVSWLDEPDVRRRLIARLKKYSLRGYRRVVVPNTGFRIGHDGLAPAPTDPRSIAELRSALSGHMQVVTHSA
jgi:hypothetical protein